MRENNNIMTAVWAICLLFLFFFVISMIGSTSAAYNNYAIPVLYGWLIFILILVAIVTFTLWLTKQFTKSKKKSV
jgi:hypothetical protein